MITTAALVNGPTARDIRVKNPWPGQDVQVVSGANPATVVVPTSTAAIITIPAAANGSYLVQRPTAPTSALPTAILSGTAPTAARHLANSSAKIGLDVPGYEPPGPCPTPTQTPLFALDPSAGDTIRDWSSYGRDAVWGGGAATYLATGPTGSSREHRRHALPAHARPRRSATCARRRGRRRSRSTPPAPTAASGTGRRPAAATASGS